MRIHPILALLAVLGSVGCPERERSNNEAGRMPESNRVLDEDRDEANRDNSANPPNNVYGNDVSTAANEPAKDERGSDQ